MMIPGFGPTLDGVERSDDNGGGTVELVDKRPGCMRIPGAATASTCRLNYWVGILTMLGATTSKPTGVRRGGHLSLPTSYT